MEKHYNDKQEENPTEKKRTAIRNLCGVMYNQDGNPDALNAIKLYHDEAFSQYEEAYLS